MEGLLRPFADMKSTVFARPNLKLFLLGAVLVVAIHHLVNVGLSQGPAVRPVVVKARTPADPELERILALSGRVPASHLYAQLSYYYEAQGEYQQALRYLRLATIAADVEGEAE